MNNGGPYVRMLVKIAEYKRGGTYKIVSLLCGSIVFLIILPLIIFTIVGMAICPDDFAFLPRIVEWILSPIEIVVGLSIVAWSAWTQWTIGRGTPAPFAPTTHLVISGPYAYCRNPIELGAIIYYLGLGTIFGGTVLGVVCLVTGLAVGSLYHRFVEEKELSQRFGDEYEAYRKNTPFLIPRFRK